MSDHPGSQISTEELAKVCEDKASKLKAEHRYYARENQKKPSAALLRKSIECDAGAKELRWLASVVRKWKLTGAPPARAGRTCSATTNVRKYEIL